MSSDFKDETDENPVKYYSREEITCTPWYFTIKDEFKYVGTLRKSTCCKAKKMFI